MKNQVNKKVSKFLIALLSLVIMSVACVAFAACNEECTHSKITDGEDTATCVAGGFITHTCDDCGYTYMTATPKKAHEYGTTEKVVATCTEKGYTVATCNVCGYENKTEFVEALGHKNTTETVTAATCTKDGSKIVKCDDCGMTISVTAIPALEHAYEVETTVAATCGTDGYIVKKCSVCGDTITEKGDLATGDHTYITTSESPATCTAMGLKVEKCEVCGVEHTEVLPMIAHAYDIKSVAATCAVQAHKEKVCKACGYTESYEFEGELAAHDYKTVAETFATCVTAGKKVEVCKVCADEKITDTPATGEHTYGEAGATVEATCITEGYTPYTCTVCKTVMKKNVTPALGHEFNVEAGATVVKAVAATCTTEGYNLMKCARCDVQSMLAGEAALGHDYVVESVVAATCLTEGYTSEVCSRCDVSKKTNIVAAAGHNYELVTSKAATCFADGENLYDCSVCGSQKKEVVATTGHAWGEPTVINATCTTPGYEYKTCEVCGEKSATVETAPALNPEAGHDYDVEVLVAANCYQTGKAINTCKVCGYSEEVVLGITEHTYHIADAVANGTIEDLKINFPALYAKYEEKGADYYCTVNSVSCTEMGSIVKKCDYCEVRYQDGSEAALGHNFESTTHVATCYNEGYTVLECTRCHYEAGERTNVVAALAHVMTVKSAVEGNPDLMLYATMTADGIKIYRDETLTTELPAAEFCNVFYKDAENANYVFFCDKCHEDLGKDYIAAATRVETAYIYTDTTGTKYTVYATTIAQVADTKEASAQHDYSLEADPTDSDALVCEAERKEIYYCINCKAEDREYNKTALTEVDGKFVNDPKEHYCDVAYVWHYHELPGVPTIDGYEFWVDANGDGVKDEGEVTMINTMVGAVCTTDATYNFGCKICGISLVPADEANGVTASKVDKDTIANTNIAIVYNAWFETLTEEEKAAEEAKAYVDFTEAMMSSEALGHNFDVANGAEYAVMAYDGTNFTERTCTSTGKLVVVIKCANGCGEINYTAAEGTYEGEKYDIATATLYDNVAHGTIDAEKLAAGEFAWTNVVYYAYNEEGTIVVGADAEKYETAIATVLNPSADGETVFECDEFTCGLCSEVVAQHHYEDRLDAYVDCYNAQVCVYCNIELKAKSHVIPEFTCYSARHDGYYYCVVCGLDNDAPALGKVTPHNVVISEATVATCTAEGAWAITCGCVEANGLDSFAAEGAFVTGLATAAPESEMGKLYAQYKDAIDDATDVNGVTTFDSAWLVIPMLEHTAGDWEVTSEATCTDDGQRVKKCTVCQTVLETEAIAALGHTHAEWQGIEAADGQYSVPVDEVEVTCAADGVITYKCKRCDVMMDGTNGTEDQTLRTPALGHNIVLAKKEGGKYNCIYGYELEAFTCTNCDAEGAKLCDISEESYKDYLILGVLYQAKAKEYLGTIDAASLPSWAEWIAADGALDYTEGAHEYTKFDTKASHGTTEGGLKEFVTPTYEKNGSAYWTCSICADRSYIENSVTVAQYYDPNVNMDYADTAAKETVKITVNEAEIEALPALVLVDYFDVTAEAFVIKAEKVTELAGKIVDALTAAAPATFTVNGVEITAAWTTPEEIAATKTAVETALNGLSLTAQTLEIAYTVAA